MKSILHIIDTTGPGGAETVFLDLISGLPADQYRSVVSIRGKGWVHDQLVRRGLTPVLLDAKGSFNWRYLRALCGLIQQERIDLIQSHLLGSNVYSALAGLITRTPVVTTFHGSVDIGENERFKWLKFGAIRAGASSVIAVTDSLRDDIACRTPLDKEKIKVIYNGIDTARYQLPRASTLRSHFGWSDSDIVIGSLGNIRPAKGYDILLKAAKLLEGSAQRYRFVIAGQGNGKLFDDMLRLREELGLENSVQFLGFIDDAAAFLSNLDLFLSSSISEGLPLSAIQAMVAKLPIIATRCGGYEGLIDHQENGWLVDVGDPHAIAVAIETLAPDHGLRNRLAENAKQYAIGAFDIRVMLNSYQELYEHHINFG